MAVDKSRLNEAYGLTQALIDVIPVPIISARNPTTSDRAQYGQMWINKTTGICFVMTKITANSYTWAQAAQTAASYTAAGAVSAGTTVTAGTTITAGTGLTVTSGGAVITAGGLLVSANGANITGNSQIAGTLTTGSVAVTGSLSTTTTCIVGTSMSAGTTVIAGTGLTVTLGNATLTNGNLIFTHAATGITLPGPTRIISGAGVPANGLAVNVGDIYINTTAATAVTRIYIATAASTWTNVTCAA
jgi:hypothetical protein